MKITTGTFGKEIIRVKENKRGDKNFRSDPMTLISITENHFFVKTWISSETINLCRSDWDDDGWEYYDNPEPGKCDKCGKSL